MRELALHLMDIAENSVAGKATCIQIVVDEDLLRDELIISVKDNGVGMDANTVARVVDPFVTSRTTRKVGLGIPLLKAAAEGCRGGLDITSALGIGTEVVTRFQHSHIDRMPLGDLPGTFLSLVVGHPEINWIFRYTYNQREFLFDDLPVKEALEGVSLTEPDILAYLRQMLEDGINEVQKQ